MKKSVLGFCALAFIAFGTSAQAQSLVGEWHFDEGRGTQTFDTSGYNLHGAIVGDPSLMWTARRWDTAALRFGGGNAVSIANGPNLEPQSISVEAWVQGSAVTPVRSHQYIVVKGSHGCASGSYALYTSDHGGLEFYVRPTTGPTSHSPRATAAQIWDGRWHHIVGTYNGTVVRLFVDGTQVGTGTPRVGNIAYGLPTSNNLYVGYYGGCPNQPTSFLSFVGQIDDVRIWNGALNPNQVQARRQGY